MNEDKVICHECVTEEYVKKIISKKGNAKQPCTYCRRKLKNLGLPLIAEMLHKVFTEYYHQSDDGEFYYLYGDTASAIIQDELGVDEDPSLDLLSVMAEIYNDYEGIDVIYDETFHYIKTDRSINSRGYAWEQMERSLRNQSRYFNQHVKDFLDDLFSDIETLKTNKSKSAIHQSGFDAIYYRARVFENYEDVKKALQHPERFFGPPPHKLARSGRMNAHGIPVFYGATSPKIAVAEVRPVVGNYVVVVPFRPLRDLRLLDISALNKLSVINGSIFDQHVADLNEKASFMRTLSRKLTMPVSGKNPDHEYLITQAVSEYLSVSEKYRLDGVSFDSTQFSKVDNSSVRHQNVVLFSKSSKIKDSANNHKSYRVELFEHIEDDEYMLSPSIQPLEDQVKNKNSFWSLVSEKQAYTLEIIPNEIVFYKIDGVSYETIDKKVNLLEPISMKTVSPQSGSEHDDY